MPKPRILIVEDEPLIALLLGHTLQRGGYLVAETADSLDAALDAAARSDCDAAIFDINLRGRMSYPAAEALARRGIPFIFVTGYASQDVPPALRHAPVVPKPYRPDQLFAALNGVLGRRLAS